MAIRTVEWRNGRVVMLDQRVLPTREVYRVYRDYRHVAEAIRTMVVRGAPAIGVAAAMGIALGARSLRARTHGPGFERLCKVFAGTRPTAVNLFWAIERMRRTYLENRRRPLDALCGLLEREALAIHAEDIAANEAMGRFGAALLPRTVTVLTHCNAGALATAGYGTALGVIRAARAAGKHVQVYACETRPFLQGARLTAWELVRDRIPVTLITDGMAAHFMARGAIDCVIVGADRVAANGDVANKIGTYTHAVVAKRHGIPFYVAAPTTTVDLACADGSRIPIEERAPEEVTHLAGKRIAPAGVKVGNPAFDVTPAALVAAIVTEVGVARRPYARALRRLVRCQEPARASAAPARRVRARAHRS
jgi:methylthioribose-1-phosphate isomerase